MRRERGFTLIELLVALFVLAMLAALSWRGLDGMMRAREQTEARSDEVLALQTGLAQWNADLDAIASFAPTPALEWNGRVLRLTRQSSLAREDGARVVGWSQREGQWRRWESGPLFTRGELETAWQEVDQWARNPSDAMRQREVAVMPLAQWQVFYFRENAWSNPLSTPGASPEAPNPNPGPNPNPAPTPSPQSLLPDGVRLVLDLPPGRALAGQLSRDWVRPTLTP